MKPSHCTRSKGSYINNVHKVQHINIRQNTHTQKKEHVSELDVAILR